MIFSNPKRSLSVVSILRYLARVLFFPFYKILVEGLENIPSGGSFVLLAKHQRWVDIPFLGMVVKKPLYYMAKKELFESFISRRIMSLLGAIPVDRKIPARNRNSFGRMLEFMEKGEGIVVFPEGGYYRDKMGPGHRGLISIALTRGDSVLVPVGISYTKKKFRFHTKISIGKPVGNIFNGDSKKMTDYVMKEIALHSGLVDGN